MRAETITSRQSSTFLTPVSSNFLTPLRSERSTRSRSNIETSFRPKLATINIEFSSKRKVHARDVDTVDAVYKINTFLDGYSCHFTQKLTYEKSNTHNLLDQLSMECSIIPPGCRGAYYNLIGYFYSSLEKYEKADRYFDMALKLNAEDTVAYANKSRNFMKKNEILKVYPLIRRLREIKAKNSHYPGAVPLALAQNTIALAYNKLGLSCAALRFYDKALETDTLNFDSYLGKGEVLVTLSKHQGRANAMETLNEGISCIRKYIGEYNVLNLARERDARQSPLPRDNKAVNNIFAVILLVRALNERTRLLGADYSLEVMDYIELVLDHSSHNAYVLYHMGDEKRLMEELDGEKGALNLLRSAISLRESAVIYHSYALVLLRWERLKYEQRFRVAIVMTNSEIGLNKDVDSEQLLGTDKAVEESRKKSTKHPSSKSDKPKPFVFDGDNEFMEGMIKVAKLLKHALKVSYNKSTAISLDLAQIYCSLNRKSEAEAMFRVVMVSSNPTEKETAYRKYGRFLIKIGDFEKGEEMIEETLKLRTQVNLDEEISRQLEETVNLLADHYEKESNGKGKYWADKRAELHPELTEDQAKGQKSSRERRR